MAVLSKTFINDLGSDVVAEIVSQLNSASGFVVGPAQNDTSGGLTVNLTWIPNEDVWVEDIQFLTVGATDHTSDSLLVYVGENATIDNVANTKRFEKTNFNVVNLAAGTHALSSTAGDDAAGSWNAFSLNSGERLWFQFVVNTGSTQTLLDAITICYRPVEDKLTLSPPQSVKAFSSVNR
tara:strand:- start:421 stop:960 length:540 start_codon:yes stop_codon:yes gene_type:complete